MFLSSVRSTHGQHIVVWVAFALLFSLLVGMRGSSSGTSSTAAAGTSSGARAERVLHALTSWVGRIGYHEWRRFSQNYEDGVIDYIFASVGTTNRYFVEFGVENGAECLSRNLLQTHGWDGLMMDGGYENPKRHLHKEWISTENIVQLLEKYQVPSAFDFLSVDTDYSDYWLLKKVLERYSPRVVAVEVNSKIASGHAKTVPDGGSRVEWDHQADFFGASVAAFHELGARHGYSMVYCEQFGVNCFLVRDDVLGVSLADVLLPALLHRNPRFGPKRCGYATDQQSRQFIDVRPPIGDANVSERGMLVEPKWAPKDCQ